jgi:hypothetical protein
LKAFAKSAERSTRVLTGCFAFAGKVSTADIPRIAGTALAHLKQATKNRLAAGSSFQSPTFDTTKPDPAIVLDIMSIDNELIHRLTVPKSEISHQ